MIKKRKRAELYDKFRQGAIPSGADFADLIRSQLNLWDDGIDISDDPSDPVCFRAHGEKENILDFSNTDGQKRWRISGLCEDGSKEGLNIQVDERSKLYIERETGNVGINTDQPAAKLHIIQNNAANALRIDDESNDTTAFTISSEGQVGIGVESPKAKLHVSYDGTGDVLRVDDTNEDTTPFIIDEKGFLGIGCDEPKARLTVMDGGVSIGKNEDPGTNSLFVAGDLEVVGNIIVAGGMGKGEIIVDGPIRASAKDFYIEDNVFIVSDPEQTGANGNLSVAGDTTLGTFNIDPDARNVVQINGKIVSGNDPQSGNEQYELNVNEALTVNRDPLAMQVNVKGNLNVTGKTTLGDALTDNIYLNGKVSSSIGDLIVDDNLTVTGSTTLGKAPADAIYLNGVISSNVGDVIINDNLKVAGDTTLGDAISDNIYLNGTIRSPLSIANSVDIGNDLNINGLLSFRNSTPKINGIVTAVTSGNDAGITTEGAVKRYVDVNIGVVNNQIGGINTQINNINGRINDTNTAINNTNARINNTNNAVTSTNNRIDAIHVPTLVRDVRYLRVPGQINGGSWGHGHEGYLDIAPLSGFTINQLVYFSVSPFCIPFSGGVDANDTLACWAEVVGGSIRCHCGNSEQRDYSTIAFYGLWQR